MFLFLGFALFTFVSSQSLLSECEGCCSLHFEAIFFPGDARDSAIGLCQTGCFGSGFGFNNDCVIAEDEFEEECTVGIDFRIEGVHRFLDGVGDPQEQFCVPPGVIASSAAPTRSPIPRSRAPVSSPVPEVESSEDSLPILPIALGAVGGCVLVVAAVLFLIIPRPKYKFDEGLTENEFAKIQEETRSVGTATVLKKQAIEREKFAGKIIKYKVIQAFDAEAEDELSLKVGEIVEGITPVDEEWWIVRRDGSDEEGLVPLAFLKEHEVINLVEEEKPDDPNDELPGPTFTGNFNTPHVVVEEPLEF